MDDKEAKEKMIEEMKDDLDGLVVSLYVEQICDHLIRKGWRKRK